MLLIALIAFAVLHQQTPCIPAKIPIPNKPWLCWSIDSRIEVLNLNWSLKSRGSKRTSWAAFERKVKSGLISTRAWGNAPSASGHQGAGGMWGNIPEWEAVRYRGRWSSKPGNRGSGRGSCTGPHGHWSPTPRQGCQPADLRENRQHTLRMTMMLGYQ